MTTSLASDREARIRQRAYELWVEDGCPDGRASAHWTRAETLIAGEEALAGLSVPAEPSVMAAPLPAKPVRRVKRKTETVQPH